MRSNFFFKEWTKRPSIFITLIYLKNNKNCYATKLCKKINITHRTGWAVFRYLLERKLIYRIKDKRRKYIYLTDKGKVIANKLEELDLLFNVTIK